LPDKTPPASVTDLNETKVGQNFIEWAWKNPEDPDFLKTMIYLNDEFLTNLSKTITKFNATNLTPDTEYKIGIKTVDEAGNINQSIVEDYARTLAKQHPGNKTWEDMNFTERKALVEEFLRVDPTKYEAANTCGWIEYRGYYNMTHAKELYGLEDNIPACLDRNIHAGAPTGHMNIAILIGNNKSNPADWYVVDVGGDGMGPIYNPDLIFPKDANFTDNIWGKAEWLENYFKEDYPSTPDGINCSDHKIKFRIKAKAGETATVTIEPESRLYVIYPATNAKDL